MKKFTFKPAALYIICAMIAILTSAASFLAWRYLKSHAVLMYMAIAIFVFVGVLLGLWLLPAYFRRTFICLSADSITIYTGIFYLKREQLRLSSAQYITRISTPLSSISGFNFLMIHALGGNMLLPFLKSEDCDEIERMLSNKITEKGEK